LIIPSRPLRQIVVDLQVFLVSSHVLALNQTLYALLDKLNNNKANKYPYSTLERPSPCPQQLTYQRSWREPAAQLSRSLSDELVMVNSSTSLQNAHDSRFRHVSAKKLPPSHLRIPVTALLSSFLLRNCWLPNMAGDIPCCMQQWSPRTRQKT
jgi:hypothetical protein